MKKFLICFLVGLFLVTSLGIGCEKKEEKAVPKTEVTEEVQEPELPEPEEALKTEKIQEPELPEPELPEPEEQH